MMGRAKSILVGLIVLATTVASAAPEPITVLTMAPAHGEFRKRFYVLKEVVERDFSGGANVKLLIDGEVGTEEAMIGALRRGRGQYGQLTIPGTSGAVPELALLMAPYLFRSFEEADFVLDRYVRELAGGLLAERGLAFLGWVEFGWWNMFGKKPLQTPQDIVGYRMRAAGGDASGQYLRALKADVVPLAFADIIPSLQTGLIEGGATNEAMFGAVGIYQHAPHLTVTRHAINPGMALANLPWFETLTPSNQDVVRDALGSAELLRRIVRQEACDALATARAGGATIHVPSPDVIDAWAKPASTVHRQLIADIGGRAQDLYDRIIAGRSEFAGLGVTPRDPCSEAAK